jgi:hypothetical protein
VEPVEFRLVLTDHREQRSADVLTGGRERRRGRTSGGKKKKLNYAFLKPEIVETKEECRPASAIRNELRIIRVNVSSD